MVHGLRGGTGFPAPRCAGREGLHRRILPVQTTASDTTGGAAQKFVEGTDIQGDWWTLFHSETLNKLVEASLKGNPDLEAAQASLRQAQENYYAAEGAFFPSVDAAAGVTRERLSATETGIPRHGQYLYPLQCERAGFLSA